MPPIHSKGRLYLRPMTLADLDQVIAIDQASFPTPWPKDAFHYELVRNRNSVCCLAEWQVPDKKPEIVASIVIWLVLDEAHIGTLAVKPGYRRQGIAQFLLAGALMACVKQGATQALLEVRKSNKAAQVLYQKFGFKDVGLRRGYYKDTHEDAILMTLAPLSLDNLAELAKAG